MKLFFCTYWSKGICARDLFDLLWKSYLSDGVYIYDLSKKGWYSPKLSFRIRVRLSPRVISRTVIRNRRRAIIEVEHRIKNHDTKQFAEVPYTIGII